MSHDLGWEGSGDEKRPPRAASRTANAIRPSVVQLSSGAGFDPEDPATPGSIEKHGNPNVLTADHPTAKLAQSCTAQSCLVEVERAVGEAPEVTAFDVRVEA